MLLPVVRGSPPPGEVGLPTMVAIVVCCVDCVALHLQYVCYLLLARVVHWLQPTQWLAQVTATSSFRKREIVFACARPNVTSQIIIIIIHVRATHRSRNIKSARSLLYKTHRCANFGEPSWTVDTCDQDGGAEWRKQADVS